MLKSMYHYLNKFAFYKNTYGKPYLVRLEFEVLVPGECVLVADNLCNCDSWFIKNDKIEIKYNVVYRGEFVKYEPSLIKKSLIVDLNRPISEDDFLQLTITNTAGISDKIQVNCTELSNDLGQIS